MSASQRRVHTKSPDDDALPSWLQERLQAEGHSKEGKEAIAESIRKVYVAAAKKGVGKGKLGSMEAIANKAASRLGLPVGWLTRAASAEGGAEDSEWLMKLPKKRLFSSKPLQDTQVDEDADEEMVDGEDLDGEPMTPTEIEEEIAGGPIEVEESLPEVKSVEKNEKKKKNEAEEESVDAPKAKKTKKTQEDEVVDEEPPETKKSSKKKSETQEDEATPSKAQKKKKSEQSAEVATDSKKDGKGQQKKKKTEENEEPKGANGKGTRKTKKTEDNEEEPEPTKQKPQTPTAKAKAKAKAKGKKEESPEEEQEGKKDKPSKGKNPKPEPEPSETSESDAETESEEERKPPTKKAWPTKQTKLDDLKSVVRTVRPDVLRKCVSGQDKGKAPALQTPKGGKGDKKDTSALLLGGNDSGVSILVLIRACASVLGVGQTRLPLASWPLGIAFYGAPVLFQGEDSATVRVKNLAKKDVRGKTRRV